MTGEQFFWQDTAEEACAGWQAGADGVQRETARCVDAVRAAERGHGQEHGFGLRERVVQAGVCVRKARHLITGDGEACGHELRGEVVLAAVAAEDGKILDQIHPFFPTYPMQEGREWGLFV